MKGHVVQCVERFGQPSSRTVIPRKQGNSGFFGEDKGTAGCFSGALEGALLLNWPLGRWPFGRVVATCASTQTWPTTEWNGNNTYVNTEGFAQGHNRQQVFPWETEGTVACFLGAPEGFSLCIWLFSSWPCCELAKKSVSQLQQVGTPCTADHLLKKEHFEVLVKWSGSV